MFRDPEAFTYCRSMVDPIPIVDSIPVVSPIPTVYPMPTVDYPAMVEPDPCCG